MPAESRTAKNRRKGGKTSAKIAVCRPENAFKNSEAQKVNRIWHEQNRALSKLMSEKSIPQGRKKCLNA